MPNSATEKLLKILKLEAERGYQDKAVTRGLASFAAAWLADAAKMSIDSAWANSVADEMRSYSAATDVAERRAAMNALITRLQAPTPTHQALRNTPQPQAREQVVAPPREARPERTRAAPQFADRPQGVRPLRAPRPAPANRQPAPVEPAQPETQPEGFPPEPPTAELTPVEKMVEAPVVARETAPATPKPATRPPQHISRPPAETRASEQRSARPASRSQASKYTGVGLDAPVSTLTGIGPTRVDLLAKLGVFTIRDLLYHYPTRYDDYSALKTINQLEYGESVTIIARVAAAFKHRTKSGAVIVRVRVEDLSGEIECSWFTTERFVENLMKQFVAGREIVISGKVTEYLGKLMFQGPLHEPVEKEWLTGGSIVPVYRLTEGLQPLLLRGVMKRLVEYWPSHVQDFVPASARYAAGLMSTTDALREIHFPRDLNTQERARRRLAFDELFLLQSAILKQRKEWQDETAQPISVDQSHLELLKGALPYTLTGAQSRAIDAIANDLGKTAAMHRLLQGDVGSGKTVVAVLAMALAAKSGAQSALMAPTEILAEQHYKNLTRLFESIHEKGVGESIKIALLTGSVSAADKRAIYAGLADGSIQIAIGTQALIQEGVSFKKLGMVVIDEQHRFGVEQRKALRTKGQGANPHTLVMTATPIPRTLALTLYGDLDNTVLDEMPPGRQPIETHWFTPAERERAYRFVTHQINEGRQAFIICPLVEESEKIEAKAAIEEHERLQREVFPKHKLGLLHGRMKAEAKESVMAQFASGELNILVSTSVVEVGIDVPNATVMMIEGANRFGLSQLHQFRGRVGRGQYQSYCLLIADSTASISDERLMAIVTTQDGFKLAEKDLEIRGPGEFFGTRQSGEPELKLVNIHDRDLLMIAREQAERIFQQDAQLAAPENRLLAEKILSFWTSRETHGDAS